MCVCLSGWCLVSAATTTFSTYLEMAEVVLPLQVTHRKLNRVEVEALGELALEGGVALWHRREGRLARYLERGIREKGVSRFW